MLKIELRPHEAISIGSVIVTLESKSGQVARLSIQADKSVPIARVQRDNAAAIAAQGGITGKP